MATPSSSSFSSSSHFLSHSLFMSYGLSIMHGTSCSYCGWSIWYIQLNTIYTSPRTSMYNNPFRSSHGLPIPLTIYDLEWTYCLYECAYVRTYVRMYYMLRNDVFAGLYTHNGTSNCHVVVCLVNLE